MKGRAQPALVLVAAWMTAALGLGVLLVAGEASREPRDDPDPVWQRPGFLDAGELPVPAPPLAPGVPPIGRPAVVFFTRDPANLCQALAKSRLAEKADLILVGLGADGCPHVRSVVDDDDGHAARSYGMRSPEDGRYPVGYVVVDSKRAIRYRTLDPGVGQHLPEVGTMVEATL
jgi:hypothetical protein